MAYWAYLSQDHPKRGAILDLTLSTLYLLLTAACDFLLTEGFRTSFDVNSMRVYRGAIWSTAIVWTVVSVGRVCYYVKELSFYSNLPKNIRKAVGLSSLLLLVFCTAMIIVFHFMMISIVLCGDLPPDKDLVLECGIWESTEVRRKITGTLLVVQVLIPGILLVIPMGLVLIALLFHCLARDSSYDDQ